MSKSNVNTNKVSGFRIAVMVISILLLSLIMGFSMLLGLSALKSNKPVELSEDATTYRKRLPANGARPKDATALDSIGYMAYVFDNQQYYHAYAYNSTKSTGYEQITQSWKDYKNGELSGNGNSDSVMVASDLSYSALVKSATQSCFIGTDKALIRNGGKPSSKNTKPLDLEWATSAPTIYDKSGYKYAYGEFSTEISVYVINEDTIERADDVVDNGDGTYSRKYYLNKNAGVWYQYGMKTRGGLKNFPEFKKIEITFTFDDNWRILESHCDEKATISPRALGGMNMASDSVTDTWFNYGEDDVDVVHFAFYENYFKTYENEGPGSPGANTEEEPDALTILGGGFSQVLSDEGQQFKLAITVGDIEYDGRVYLKIPDMGNVIETLDARIALEKKGTGKQDLYIDFKDGALNVFYSTGFALTADIDGMLQSVSKIVDLVEGLTSSIEPNTRARAVDGDVLSGLDLTTIIENLKVSLTDTEATVTLKSDDLLGLGVGIDAVIGFSRSIDEDGFSTFGIKTIDLNYVKFGGTVIDVNAEIVPDDGAVIERKTAQTPANLADYVDSVYNILKSNTVKIDIGLTDQLIEGLTLDATAYLSIASEIASDFEISLSYDTYTDISLKLLVSYVIDSGNLYINVTEFNGRAVNAKVYCNIADAVDTIGGIIDVFNEDSAIQNPEQAQALASSREIADIINKILNLNFAKIIGNITGNEDEISLNVNVDELLKGLDVSIGMQFGTARLTLDKKNEKISGSFPSFGLTIDISGSEEKLPSVGNFEGYLYVNDYLSGIKQLVESGVYEIGLKFAGKQISKNIDLSGLEVNATAYATLENGYKNIAVSIPGLLIGYKGLEVELSVYYSIDISSKDYGRAYLEIKRINSSDNLGIKVYCDIKDTVATVQEIIDTVNGSEEAQVISAQSEVSSSSIISKVVGILLSLDYNEVIHSTQNSLSVTLNVDDILAGLEIDLGISFGELQLALTLDGDNNLALVGNLSALGVKEVSVKGNDSYTMPQAPEEGEYVDLATYLESVKLLLNKKSYTLDLTFSGNEKLSSDIDLTGVELTLNAQFAFVDGYSGVRVIINELAGSYNKVSLALSAYYEVSFSGGYGTVYLNITDVNGSDVDAKIKLDITDAAKSIKAIIERFGLSNSDSQEDKKDSDFVGKLIAAVLQLDFSEFLKITKDKAELNLDLNALLSGSKLGLNLGVITLEYTPGNSTLKGWDSEIGLEKIELSGSDSVLSPIEDTAGYINVNNFIDGVENLVKSSVYELSLDFAGKKIGKDVDLSGLTVNATAYATVKNGYNNISVSIPDLAIGYKGLDVELSIYYIIDISAKNYGKVYLDVTKIGKSNPDMHISCDIKKAVTTVEELIAIFSPEKDGKDTKSGSSDIISKVVEILLSLDYDEVINCTQNNLSVTLKVDDLLSNLGIKLGVTFGELKLDLTLDESNMLSLKGKLPSFGVNDISLKGNEEYKMPEIEDTDYVDFGSYLDSIYNLLKKPLYDVKITLDGTKINDTVNVKGINLADLSLDVTATMAIDGGIIRVLLPATVVYGDYSIGLTAYYTINLSDKNYGTVYLNITSITAGEETQELDAKVYCEIKSVVSDVQKIIAKFAPKKSGGSDGTGEEVSVISKVIDLLIKLDYTTLLNITDESLTVNVDVNEILSGLGVSLGDLTLGNLNLSYVIKNNAFDGSLEALGLSVKLSGKDGKLEFSDKGYINLNEFVSAIENLVNSKTYEVEIGFIGKEIEGVDLEGLRVDATAYATLKNGYKIITVSIPKLHVNYNGLDVVLSVYYSINLENKNYGTVYLNLLSINGTTFEAKVYCDIQDAVGTVENIIKLFKTADDQLSPKQVNEGGDGGANIVAKVVGLLLKLDYNEIIHCTQNNLSVKVNVDEILSELDLGVGGITFGELQLNLTQNKGKDAVLSGKLEKYGVTLVSLKGNDSYAMPVVKPEEYLNLNTILKIAEDMAKEGKKIADASDVVFTVLLDATIDGKPVKIVGEGEVSWLNGSVKVEISLDITVDKETLAFTFVYDETAADEDAFIVLAINRNWTKISRSEIDTLVTSFGGLIDALSPDENNGDGEGNGEEGDTPDGDTLQTPDSAGYAISVGDKSLEDILTNRNVKKVLGKILGFVSEFVVEVKTDDGEDALSHLIIKYSDGIVIKPDLGTDGGLILTVQDGEKLVGRVTVDAGIAEDFNPIADKINYFTSKAKDEVNNPDGYVYGDLSAFVKALYTNAFGRLDDALDKELKELLGNSYSVELRFNGNNSGIDVLEGINIEANLYYGDGTVGLQRKQTKLLYAYLNLDINGTGVLASVVYEGSTVYIALEKVGTTNLTGIKVKTDVSNIFDAAEQLVRIITDTNLVEMLGGGKNTLALSDKEAIGDFATLNDENGTPAPSRLTKLLDAILELDFKKAFDYNEEEGTLKVNIDSITQALLGVDFGNISATFDKENKTLEAEVRVGEGEAWITLNANPCESKENEIVLIDYFDIGFISTLLSDIKNTATAGGHDINTVYTLTGTISVKIASILTVNFKNTKLTAGLDDNGKFYASMTASIDSVLLDNSNVCFTYADGFIVLGRDIDQDSAQYKVLTMDYLLDNLFKGDNILKWYLGIQLDYVWKKITAIDALSGIDSGLTTPQNYYLYETLQQTQADNLFALADYVSGMEVKAGGNSSTFGNGANLANSKLGLSGDYYAFDLNAEKLTGGILSSLCAAITRNESGLSGLKAYGAMPYITFSVNLTSITAGSEVALNNYLDYVTETYGFDSEYDKFASGPAHTSPIFGCFNSNGTYSPSYVLDTVKLYVYGLNGEVERTLEVRYGSEVYLIREGFPEFADESKTSKLIYVNGSGVDLEMSMTIDESVIDEDGIVRIYKTKSLDKIVNVEFHFIDMITGNEIINPQSFAVKGGDKLIEYVHGGYSFIGWYTSKDFKTPIDTVNVNEGTLTVYGKYIKTLYDAENGVRYAFDPNLYDPDGKIEGKGGYYVSGTNDNISQYYNREDKWLEIASEINDYPVYYIGVDAFAMQDYDTNSIVNVIIPESIIAIYDNAFAYNKNLQKVLICADNVFIGGGASKDMGSSAVFYGCYGNIKNNVNENLNVYYINTRSENPYKGLVTITSDSLDNNWHRIYFKAREGFEIKDTIYTLNRFTTSTKGWSFINFTVSGDSALSEYVADLDSFIVQLGFVSGFGGLSFSAAEIGSIVLNEINKITANEENSFINGFKVEVICEVSGKKVDGAYLGKYTEVEIIITEAEKTDRAYRVNLNATVDGDADNSAVYVTNEAGERIDRIDGYYYLKEGKYFIVIANSSYQINPGDLAFDEKNGKYYFTVADEAIEIDVECSKIVVSEFILYSEVQFKFESDGYAVADGGKQATVSANVESLASPVSVEENYVFIGWAYLDGENYIFIGDTLNKNEYHAVWAYDNRNAFESFTAKGSTLITKVTGNAAGVHSWYYEEYKNGLGAVAVCNNNEATFTALTKTILHARLIFSLTVDLDASSTNWYYSRAEGDDVQDISVNSTTGSVSGGSSFSSIADGIVEGYKVEVYRYWENGLVIKIYDGNEYIATYLIKGRYYAGVTKGGYKWRNLFYDSTHYFAAGDGGWSLNSDSDNTTSNSSTVYYKAYDSSVDNSGRIIGTVESTGSNLSFTCKA